MSKVKICDICKRVRQNRELNSFRRYTWTYWYQNKRCGKFDICDTCLERIGKLKVNGNE